MVEHSPTGKHHGPDQRVLKWAHTYPPSPMLSVVKILLIWSSFFPPAYGNLAL